MATKVFMEALSPTMEEGRLVKWLKNEGDTVASGDVLAEVETDKAVMELVARGDGVLRKRFIADETTAAVGNVIGVIAGADEDISAIEAEAGGGSGGGGDDAKAPPAAPEADAPAPPQQKGDDVAPAGERRSPLGGTTDGHAITAGRVRTTRADAPEDASAQPTQPTQPTQPARSASGERVRTSPLARRIAGEQGIDLQSIEGSGPGGRIIKRDLEGATTAATPAPSAAGARISHLASDFEDAPLTQIRKTIARRLSESIGPIPTFYLTVELDVERVAEARSAMAAMGDEFKASFNDIILKAVATALSQHPEVNAHWLGDKIRYHNRVHLGMAVATDDGLIVPVIFDADRMSLREISAASRDYAKRARERKLKPEEYTGSTFSVSNLGMFQVEQFTAIINPPEAGILAIGSIEEKAVVADGELQVRKRLRVTMSCDHRVIDGAVGAKFLQSLRRLVENPLMLVF
ncbi:MAG: 2-oxo acid dehydrogenase subunit E2 [Gemmatimonadaceae bacterium]|nr:2-oxo acid dehydrogenase subunit E2 [Gemmatimonadaceae bacterium]